MLKGGYQIIDLEDTALVTTSAGQTITGLYSAIGNANRKAILLSNITIGTTQYNNVFVDVYVNANSKYEWVVYGYTWTVDANSKLVLTAN